MVIVGDRGMLTRTRIDTLKKHSGLGWISALRSGAIRGVVEAGAIERSLFDERNLAEIVSPEFPGERLIVCFNPLLADERKRKRNELLAATETALGKIAREVARRTRTPLKKDQIGLRVGKVINRRKMQKHFKMKMEDGLFEWSRNEQSISREEGLDGIYVIRTSEPEKRISAADTVRKYKSLSLVERAFRAMKGIDLRVRPIFHRLSETVQAHIFLCMLAYHVEWHMREALAPLLFHDEDLKTDRQKRDPVAPAKASRAAKGKKASRTTNDGLPIHSFQTLLAALSTRCKNLCRTRNTTSTEITEIVTNRNPLQRRASELIEMYPVSGNPDRT